MSFHIAFKRIHIIIFSISFLILFTAKQVFEEKTFINLPNNFFSKKVALTFDDGPHPYYTEKIIDILSKYNIKATFFLVGKQIEKYPKIFKLLLDNKNYKIGNHTYSHKNLTKLSSLEIYNELFKAQNLMFSLGDNNQNIISYFRPPGGHYDYKVTQIAEKIGLKMVLWSVFTNDHLENITKKDLLDSIDKLCVGDKEIILLHSGSQATLDALEDIIKLLKNKGYIFVNVDEILNETDFSS